MRSDRPVRPRKAATRAEDGAAGGRDIAAIHRSGAGGNGQNPGARIAIQQRVTSKIYVDFETDVTSTQQQVIKFEYHATPRLSINASRDQNGGFGFDTRIHKTW